MYHICTQNIWKVCNLRPKHSKSIEFLRKTIERIHTCNSITRKVFVSHSVSKHLKSIWFWNKTFEKYLVLLHNIQKVLYTYTEYSKSIWVCPKTFDKYRLSHFFLSETRKKLHHKNLERLPADSQTPGPRPHTPPFLSTPVKIFQTSDPKSGPRPHVRSRPYIRPLIRTSTHIKYFIGHPHDPVHDLRKLVLWRE